MSKEADTLAWVQAMRRDADRLKVSITSNARAGIDIGALTELASRVEQVFKDARALVQTEGP